MFDLYRVSFPGIRRPGREAELLAST